LGWRIGPLGGTSWGGGLIGGCSIGAGAILSARLHAALAAGFGGALAVVGEIAGIVAGTTAAMTMLAAAPTGFDGLFAVVGEIARIAGATGPSGLFGSCAMGGRGLLVFDSAVALGLLIHLILPPVVRNRANAMPD
jgi:hypothetical protein